MAAISDRIIEVRKYKGLNQNNFSIETKIPRSTLSEVESGKNQPSTALIAAIANRFKDIDMNWILTGEGTMLKGGVAGNESFSEEDIRLLRLIKALAPEQKNDTVKDLEKFVRWNKSAISHFLASNQGEQQRVAA